MADTPNHVLVELAKLETLVKVLIDRFDKYEAAASAREVQQQAFNQAIDKRVTQIETDRAAQMPEFRKLVERVHSHSNVLQQAKGMGLMVKGLLITCGMLAGALIEGLAKGLLH